MFDLCWLLVLYGIHLSLCNAVLINYEEKDLATYVSRPDIRSPIFDVTIYQKDALTPGYWFTAPYVDLRERLSSSEFAPGQIGPHIYDQKGNLVFSGSHMVGDRTAFDFKAVSLNGSEHLALLLDHDNTKREFKAGAGVIFNSNFEWIQTVQNLVGNGLMNMHEFNIVDDGQKALTITFRPQMLDYSGRGEGPFGWIGNNGFQELDLRTGKVLFSWWALDHVTPDESYMQEVDGSGSSNDVWDWFHMNSVDKNEWGDYLISSRYTNTIYKISGKDGHIIWRLGGKNSSFKQTGFSFSAQHDARFRRENESHTTISFLNNAANGHSRTSNTSAVIVAELNTQSMEASLIHSFKRPDHALTKLRGNAQEMPNGNYFICWSENGHISEHTPQGELVMKAQFSSERFVTYRGGKFNFTGKPTWPPAIKGFAYGVNAHDSTTTAYVSWNGATEVQKWRFRGSAHANSPSDEFSTLGEIEKEGFETMFMKSGYVPYVYAEAISETGEVLGMSPVSTIITPSQWKNSEAILKHKDDGEHHHGPDQRDFKTHRTVGMAKVILTVHKSVLQKENAAAVATCVWVLTILSLLGHLCLRGWRRRRRRPWIKSEL